VERAVALGNGNTSTLAIFPSHSACLIRRETDLRFPFGRCKASRTRPSAGPPIPNLFNRSEDIERATIHASSSK